jgi:ribosome-associated heat shock protein Hsp15
MATDATFERLDRWLWCARIARQRSECARLIEQGGLRINRQPTDKPHARLRVGDVLTVPLRDDVLVLRVRALADRRGPAGQAHLLYESLRPDGTPPPCLPREISAYAPDR